MARPTKVGLDYFPVDTDMDYDDKIALVEADHGVSGFGIVIKLLMKIYSEGYFYKWGEVEQKLFMRRVNVDINLLIEVVNDCIKWSMFNKDIFENYGVLTSRGIQRRYFEATRRRKEVEVQSKYLLLSEKELEKYTNLVIVNMNSINDDNNEQSEELMVEETLQSKVEESKGKDSIEEGTKNKQKVLKEMNTSVADFDLNLAKIFFKDNFEKPTKHIINDLKNWIEKIGIDLVIEAMTRSIEAQKKYRYAKVIMNNWYQNKFKTI